MAEIYAANYRLNGFKLGGGQVFFPVLKSIIVVERNNLVEVKPLLIPLPQEEI